MDSKLVYAIALVIGCWVLAAKGLKISSTHTVGDLTAPISRASCGQTKSCLETPMGCDPEGNGTCLFVSGSRITQSSTPDVAIELRGNSDNYIVLITSTNMTAGGGDAAFVCAHYNNSQFFFATTFDNGSLTIENNLMVSEVLASFSENVIRCTFTVRGFNTSQYIFAGSGNFSNGVLGDPEITLMSSSSLKPLSNMSSPSQNMNIPVGNLATTITRDTCGQAKLCVEDPADCDPSGNSDCLFVSSTTATTMRQSGIDIAFELSGNTSGYVVLILSPDMIQGGGDESFVCAEFNNTFRFFTATFDNGALTMTNGTGAVSNALASLNGTVLQCTFTALGLNATASRTTASSFNIFAGTGDFDGETLGNPTIRLSSNGSLDLTNSNSNSNVPTTMGNSGAGLPPTSLALLVLLSAFISCLV